MLTFSRRLLASSRSPPILACRVVSHQSFFGTKDSGKAGISYPYLCRRKGWPGLRGKPDQRIRDAKSPMTDAAIVHKHALRERSM